MTLRLLTNAVLSALLGPQCAVCSRLLDAPLEGAVCEPCWNSVAPFNSSAFPSPAPSLTRLGAVGQYDGTLREIIHALKYDGRRSVAPRLSQLMATHGAELLEDVDLVVPVPLHPRRQRQRGFNQAEDLAQGLGLPTQRLLRRIKSTRPQVELPASARHRNVIGAFALLTRACTKEKRIVLVDDVTTTGATLAACAQALREAGAREVRALTAARVVSGLS